MLAKNKSALRSEREAIGTGLASALFRACVTARNHVIRRRLAFLPEKHHVPRHIGKEQIFAARYPNRTFGPFKTAGEFFDLRIGRQQCVERGIEAFDRADRRINVRFAWIDRLGGFDWTAIFLGVSGVN